MKSLKFSNEELQKYNITRGEANNILYVIRFFANEFYKQKLDNTLLNFKDNFPDGATKDNIC